MQSADYNNLFDAFDEANGYRNLCRNLITFKDFVLPWFRNVISTPTIHINYTETNGYSLTAQNNIHVPLFVYDITNKKEHLIWLLKNGTFCYPNKFELNNQDVYLFNNEGKGVNFQLYFGLAWRRMWQNKIDENISLKSKYVMLEQYWYKGPLQKYYLNKALKSTNKTEDLWLMSKIKPRLNVSVII